MPSYKFVASQAKCIYSYKNLREKVQRCCASIYFNRQCLKLGVIQNTLKSKSHIPLWPLRYEFSLNVSTVDFNPLR